jgi:hypothetical protein
LSELPPAGFGHQKWDISWIVGEQEVTHHFRRVTNFSKTAISVTSVVSCPLSQPSASSYGEADLNEAAAVADAGACS